MYIQNPEIDKTIKYPQRINLLQFSIMTSKKIMKNSQHGGELVRISYKSIVATEKYSISITKQSKNIG